MSHRLEFTVLPHTHQFEGKAVPLLGRIAELGPCVYLAFLPLILQPLFPLVPRVLLVAAAAARVVLTVKQHAIRIPRSPVFGLFFVFVAVSTLTVFRSTSVVASSWAAYRALLPSVLVFALIACAPAGGGGRRPLAYALACLAPVLSVACFARFLLGKTNPWGGLSAAGWNYNAVCMFLVAAAPFAFVVTLEQRGWRRHSWGAICVLVTTSVVLTFSRVGWLAFAVVIIVLWLSLVESRRVLVASVVCAAALSALIMPDLGAFLLIPDNDELLQTSSARCAEVPMKRASLRDLRTFNDRCTYAWKPALRIIADHPVLGAGYGVTTFDRVAPRNRPRLGHEHNALLSVGVQSGLVGIAAYLSLLAAMIFDLVRGRRQRTRTGDIDDRLRAALLAAIFAEYCVHGLAEPTNNGHMFILLAAFAAIATALSPKGVQWIGLSLKRAD